MSNMLKEEFFSVGDTVGYLTLLERDSEEEQKHKKRIYWRCKCKCGTIVTKSEASLKTETNMIRSCGCSKDINPNKKVFDGRLSPEEVAEWDELYKYVKFDVLGYDEHQNLSTDTVLRLKGLRSGKHFHNKKTKDNSNYSYRVVLMTFKYCIVDIRRGLSSKSFRNESNRVNYVFKIVENNLNTVYNRMQASLKASEQTKNVDMTQGTKEISSHYVRKTKDNTNKRLEDLW